jgi:hypothetical protein
LSGAACTGKRPTPEDYFQGYLQAPLPASSPPGAGRRSGDGDEIYNTDREASLRKRKVPGKTPAGRVAAKEAGGYAAGATRKSATGAESQALRAQMKQRCASVQGQRAVKLPDQRPALNQLASMHNFKSGKATAPGLELNKENINRTID